MPHIHELIDYTAEIFIVHQGKVLIRLHDKYDIRTCPGGHIELDENPNEGALREAKEETGLDVELYQGHQRYFGKTEKQIELVPPVFLNMHRIGKKDHYHVGMVYFAYASTDKVVPLHESDASHQRKRMSREELLSDETIEHHVKVYAQHALDAYETKE